jgi:hypothetical protein
MSLTIQCREAWRTETDDTKAKFYQKNGLLNAYSFACGYVERYNDARNDFSVAISKEHCAYMVKGSCAWSHAYKAFSTIAEARAHVRGLYKAGKA